MGKMQRDKGARYELSIVHKLNDLTEGAAEAEKIPLSGACGGSFKGDIRAKVQATAKLFECKKRAIGFKQLYEWIEPVYGLFVGADRKPTLVVLRLEDFAKLISVGSTA
jgi:Holliday junction resolvase